MSFAAKSSRAITVDGVSYRWALSPDSGYDVLVVQSASGVGAKLRVYISYATVAYAGAEPDGRLSVTPGLVTAIIRQACEHGWLREVRGRDMVCDLKGDAAIVVRASP